jgi:hypothetical protein
MAIFPFPGRITGVRRWGLAAPRTRPRGGDLGYIERRSGKYRGRYRDPLGRAHSKTFTRKADADRFVREMETEKERGNWIDQRGADQPLAQWAEEFLQLCRRLAPKSQETYRRDLNRYVLPRFGTYRLGRLPADEIENWLNDELAAGLAPSSVHRHYRILRRMLGVAVQKQKLLRRCDPPRRTTNAYGCSSTPPPTQACAGASSSVSAAVASICYAGRCA